MQPIDTQGVAITFGLLAASIVSVWIRLGKTRALPLDSPWPLLFIASIASGWVYSILQPVAILGLLALCGSAYGASHYRTNGVLRSILTGSTVLLSLAFATHLAPGFNNPVVIDGIRLSPEAVPYTQYANFDKGAVGLILLAFFCPRATSEHEWSRALATKVLAIALPTLLLVFGGGLLVRQINLDFKLPESTATFLAINLFFTVVAEESFFRGFLQSRFTSMLSGRRYGHLIAILGSGLLFGLAHAAGGATYAILATLAGIGYACAFASSRSIEFPILVHFALNATHFLAFTYPRLA